MAGERRRLMRLSEYLRGAGRSVRSSLSLLVVTAAGAVALPAVAGAVAPVRETVAIDEMFVVPAAPEGPCAFPVEVHFTGQLELTRFFDRDGNEIRVLSRLLGASATFSANGKSISDMQNTIDHGRIDPETGSITVAGTGVAHLVVPGQGVVAQDSGRLVLFFEGPDDEEPDVLFEGGRADGGPFPALCEVLAP
jgi:hypothetical protein